jgi:hypothetical protein
VSPNCAPDAHPGARWIAGEGVHKGRGLKLKRRRRKKPPTEQEVIDHCVSLGLPGSDGRKLFLYWKGKAGFPKGEWQTEVERFRDEGWLNSQKEGAQTEEESPEAVQQRKEAEEKDRRRRQEEDRRRKEEDQRRQEELHNEYLRTRKDGETFEQWETRRRLEAEEQEKKERELRRQRAEAEIEAKKNKELEAARKRSQEWERILEEDRRGREERHREYLRTKKDGETFGEWSLRMMEMKKRTNEDR